MKFHSLALAFLFISLKSMAAGPGLKSGLDEVIDRAINEKRIVGAVVMVAKKGEVIYERAAGQADRETNRPMKLDTVFRLSSLSKPIVATAALSLVDKGLLNLDDAVTKYIPDFRPKLASGAEPVITIKHLLTHTAGLGYGFFEPPQGPYRAAGVSDGMDLVNFTLEENIRRISTIPLYYSPGVAWSYSLATDILGEVLSRATNLSLEEVIKTQVASPLQMKDTSFTGTIDRVATPYVNTPNGPVQITDGMEVPFGPSYISFAPSRNLNRESYPSAGAGLLSTAPDYLKLLESIRENSGTLLKKETMATMTTDQIPEIQIGVFPGCGWSTGMMVVRDPSLARTYAPKGTLTWSGVYGHNFWIDLENDMTVVVLTNTTFEGMLGQFAQEVQATVYKK